MGDAAGPQPEPGLEPQPEPEGDGPDRCGWLRLHLPARPGSAQGNPSAAPPMPAPPCLRGCGCRGGAGHVHVACLVEATQTMGTIWRTCPTCEQEWTDGVVDSR